MAIAKRVGQDRKVVTRTAQEFVKDEVVRSVDGIVTETYVANSYYRTRDTNVFEDQPDRVVLEMSLEEAHALIYFAMDDSTPHLKKDAMAVANAVENARVSPPVGTQAYSGEGGGCGSAWDAHNGKGTNPIR